MTDWFPLAGFAFGAIFGSFIAVIATRWPQGRAVTGRSACDSCGQTLGALELIPLLSYAILRARCRSCGARIDGRHFAVELAAAFIGATAMIVSPDWIGFSGAVFGWMLLALAVLDVEHFWLPDRLTLPMMVLGLIAAAVVQPDAATGRIIGALIGYLALSLIAYSYRAFRGRDGLGGGDPKLLAAIGAWLGWAALPFVLLLASLVGVAAALGKGMRADTKLPFGALLAVAAWPIWLLWRGWPPVF